MGKNNLVAVRMARKSTAKSADGFATKIKSDSGHHSSHVGAPCFPCCPKIEKYLAANLEDYQGHDDGQGVADKRGEDLRE